MGKSSDRTQDCAPRNGAIASWSPLHKEDRWEIENLNMIAWYIENDMGASLDQLLYTCSPKKNLQSYRLHRSYRKFPKQEYLFVVAHNLLNVIVFTYIPGHDNLLMSYCDGTLCYSWCLQNKVDHFRCTTPIHPCSPKLKSYRCIRSWLNICLNTMYELNLLV